MSPMAIYPVCAPIVALRQGLPMCPLVLTEQHAAKCDNVQSWKVPAGAAWHKPFVHWLTVSLVLAGAAAILVCTLLT